MPELQVVREVHPSARLGEDVKIGPFCVIGPDVQIGARTVIGGRVCVSGRTILGEDNYVGEGCVLGGVPQDLKFRGEPTVLLIGDCNRLGRSVTAHIGTELGGYITRIGNDNVLHDGCHVAHDCYVDDRTRLGRNVLLAGHIRVQTGAVMEELSAAHHFATIGRFAWVGPRTPVRRDVPPYTCFFSPRPDRTPTVSGMHIAGLRAAALNPGEERELIYALRELFSDELALQTKIEHLMNMGADGEVAALCEFCQQSLKGVYGRYRELFRNRIPPEAQGLLGEDGLPCVGGER